MQLLGLCRFADCPSFKFARLLFWHFGLQFDGYPVYDGLKNKAVIISDKKDIDACRNLLIQYHSVKFWGVLYSPCKINLAQTAFLPRPDNVEFHYARFLMCHNFFEQNSLHLHKQARCSLPYAYAFLL